MGRCSRCGRKRLLLGFPRRLAMPELRAMVSHWPWHRVEVCPRCAEAFQKEFAERLRLLAPDAVADEGEVTAEVCLLCGNQGADATCVESGRWVDASGRAVATRFRVCDLCRGKVLVNSIVSAAELRSGADFEKLLRGLPEVSADLVQRTEGWSPAEGAGPAGSSGVERELGVEAAVNEAESFWSTTPEPIAEADGTPVRGATLKPDRHGAIRTHLELLWRSGRRDTSIEAALRVYRTAGGYVVVRFPVRGT